MRQLPKSLKMFISSGEGPGLISSMVYPSLNKYLSTLTGAGPIPTTVLMHSSGDAKVTGHVMRIGKLVLKQVLKSSVSPF